MNLEKTNQNQRFVITLLIVGTLLLALVAGLSLATNASASNVTSRLNQMGTAVCGTTTATASAPGMESTMMPATSEPCLMGTPTVSSTMMSIQK